MKDTIRTIIIGAAWLCLNAAAFSQGTLTVTGTATINVLAPWTQELDTTGTFIASLGATGGTRWMAWGFTADETGTLTQVTMHSTYMNTPEGDETMEVQIWDDTGASSAPGAVLTNGTSANVAIDTLSGADSYSDNAFTFSPGPELTATNVYYICFKADQLDADYVRLHWKNSISVGAHYRSDGDPPTWVPNDATAGPRATVSGTQ